MRKTKIIATIGPVSYKRPMLRQLIEAGMDVARLNFSHGRHETYRQIVKDIRELSLELARPVAILQDLQGVKIRTGPLQGGEPVDLQEGDIFTITTQEVEGTSRRVSTSYKELPKDVEAGFSILLSDGLLELKVLSVSSTEIETEVVAGGELAENQGINIPMSVITAPSLTDKDREDLRLGVELDIDYVALSFVRKPEDVEVLRSELGKLGAATPIIAKLEKPAAIQALDEIMACSAGVMVARGDLGVELPPERVPLIQKKVIAKANRTGKLVITATQMMESMIHNVRPTRAEASDVANAVFDGTDALMLSAETAIGEYPVESIKMMSRIIREAEQVAPTSEYRARAPETKVSFPEAVCESAYYASTAIRARAIAAFTQTGSTARMISKYRPPVEILGFTPHPSILRRMCLYWGVTPMHMDEINNVDELIASLERLLLDEKLVHTGENLIILTGAPIVEKGHTSLMKLHSIKG